MAEIEDLQVELESIICVQKLERLIDLAKYFNLEIDPEVKTKLTVIKLLRKHIEETIANEPGTSPDEQFLKDAVSFFDWRTSASRTCRGNREITKTVRRTQN